MKLRTDLTVTFKPKRLAEIVRYTLTIALLEFDNLGEHDMYFAHPAGTIFSEAGEMDMHVSFVDLLWCADAHIASIWVAAGEERLTVIVDISDPEDRRVIAIYDRPEASDGDKVELRMIVAALGLNEG